MNIIIQFISIAFPKSPFERELQRLLIESAKNKIVPSPGGAGNKTNNLDSVKKNRNGSNNNNNIIRTTEENDDSCIDSNSLKHPVGLEAIKEMTRNKT